MKLARPSLFFSVIFLVFAFLIGGCSSKKPKITANSKPAAAPVPKVEAYIVKIVPVTETLELPGSIIANEATEIRPEISGRLTYLNPAEGKTVKKGTLLAKIYDGDLLAQLNKISAQIKVLEQTQKRYGELLKISGVSQQEYDLQALEINNAKADMNIVRSNIMRTEIRAPFSGTLGLKNVSPGAYVSPTTIITTIRQDNQLKLDFTLPEKYAGKIKTGQLVNFSLEGNNKKYTSKIIATEMGISADNRSLLIRALVTNNDGAILPGNFVKVETNFDPDPDAIMIPSQAIIPQARGKQVVVYRNGIANFENVITGLRDSARIQVTSGLKPGDTIITTGLMSLKPNGKVTLTKVNN